MNRYRICSITVLAKVSKGATSFDGWLIIISSSAEIIFFFLSVRSLLPSLLVWILYNLESIVNVLIIECHVLRCTEPVVLVDFSLILSDFNLRRWVIVLLILLTFLSVIRSANCFILNAKIILDVGASLLSLGTSNLGFSSEGWLAESWFEIRGFFFFPFVLIKSCWAHVNKFFASISCFALILFLLAWVINLV